MDSNVNLESLDQHVLAPVAMEHAEPDLMPDTSVRGKTWLQVMMWFASECLGYGITESAAHGHGAYAAGVNESVERRARSGLLRVRRSDREGVIHMAKKGRDALEMAACDQDVLRHAQSIKSLLNNLNYREVIAYSYGLCPEMAGDGELHEEFEEWRLDAAVSTYLKGRCRWPWRVAYRGRTGTTFTGA